jgi:hypothetical protein
VCDALTGKQRLCLCMARPTGTNHHDEQKGIAMNSSREPVNVAPGLLAVSARNPRYFTLAPDSVAPTLQQHSRRSSRAEVP